MRKHPPHLGELAVGEHDLPCLPAEPLGRDGTDLLGDDPTSPVRHIDAMSPAGSLDTAERQEGDEMAQLIAR